MKTRTRSTRAHSVAVLLLLLLVLLTVVATPSWDATPASLARLWSAISTTSHVAAGLAPGSTSMDSAPLGSTSPGTSSSGSTTLSSTSPSDMMLAPLVGVSGNGDVEVAGARWRGSRVGEVAVSALTRTDSRYPEALLPPAPWPPSLLAPPSSSPAAQPALTRQWAAPSTQERGSAPLGAWPLAVVLCVLSVLVAGLKAPGRSTV